VSGDRLAPKLLRAAILASGLVALTGCLAFPTSETDVLRGKGGVAPQTLQEFLDGRATRADVLVRLGEPWQRRGDDRVFVYEWTASVEGWIVIVPNGGVMGGDITKQKYAAIRFDDSGVVQAAQVVERSWSKNSQQTLDDWAGPDAPPPTAGGGAR
jgi:hypothetical protein